MSSWATGSRWTPKISGSRCACFCAASYIVSTHFHSSSRFAISAPWRSASRRFCSAISARVCASCASNFGTVCHGTNESSRLNTRRSASAASSASSSRTRRSLDANPGRHRSSRVLSPALMWASSLDRKPADPVPRHHKEKRRLYSHRGFSRARRRQPGGFSPVNSPLARIASLAARDQPERLQERSRFAL